ncbi:MAG: universal stress protein [Spirochaetaceae bacterium]|nr:MAG: universal stress protein [Spirochaetaceae bacterium]
MIGQVVVGIDGSEYSMSAYKYAQYFAAKLGCELKAVFVVDSRKTELPIIYATGHFDYAFARTYIPPDPELKSFYTKIKKDLEGFASGCLKNLEASCGEGKIPFVGVRREGLPSQVLTEECRSGDLLFIGQKGENARFARAIVGSTAEDVVRSSPRPVMACPEAFRPPEKILFPYDGSPAAERALQFCVNAFGTFWNDFLVLSSEEEKGLTERERRYLDKHAINHRLVTEEGSPIDTVLEVAEREDSDLLLIGSHGTHKIRDYILGSTTVHLLRKSPLPVLIVY